MAAIKQITTMCKDGNIQEAYDLAKTDLAADADSIWAQRAFGWAIYYAIKNEAEKGDYEKIISLLTELKSLSLLSPTDDSIIFDNVKLQLGTFIKNCIFPTDANASNKLSAIFALIKDFATNPSLGHTVLLKSIIKFDLWQELADFIDWWELDNLSDEDYKPFVNEKKQKIMSTAERAYIAMSKALLKVGDNARIEAFLPKLESLMNSHEEMMYPGYFYGKLLLKLGGNNEEALKVIIPFARKKHTEFWVWQLLAEVFVGDDNKQLACLLRAVNCRTQESFLGKVRLKLAALSEKNHLYNHAKHQVEIVANSYSSQGWRMPNEIREFMSKSWYSTATSSGSIAIDYKSITDEILCEGAEEAIALVTYVDTTTFRSSIIYGLQKKASIKLPVKAFPGNVFKLRYILDKGGRMKVLSAEKAMFSNCLPHAKVIEGTINKRDDKEFAFLKSDNTQCYINSTIVKKNSLHNGDKVKALIAYDYDKKKASWNWVCISIKKN